MDISHDPGETGEDKLGHTIKTVKETLRRIPHKGIGYGILKYLTARHHKVAGEKNMSPRLQPRIRFNYLGQFDEDLQGRPFTVANQWAGPAVSPEGRREFQLDISGMIARQQLVLTATFSPAQYKGDTIDRLLENYNAALGRVIDFCASRQESQPTPADFTYTGLSIRQVERLTSRYPVQDLYTLSPMQEGMLFHWLYEKDSPAYFQQISYHFRGTLDINAVKESFNRLLARYDILRTVFIHEGTDRPLQVVLNKREMDFTYLDIRHLDSP
ncbi:MAG: hypothetical protein GY940_18025, partial [bacterium]|nr:hypothetical protein [bacterium]